MELKSMRFGKAAQAPEIDNDELEKINRQTLQPLDPEQVFTFSIEACDDQIDRDFEHFTLQALRDFAKLFIGKTVIFDHEWSAKNQTARIYDAAVENRGDMNVLRMFAYMLKTESTEPIIAAINGGILREVSVGVQIGKAICDICGADYSGCVHRKGFVYDDVICTVALDVGVDAYELSFVAVPAQKNAGVSKSADAETVADDVEKMKILREKELALIENEEKSIQKMQEEILR